MQTEIVIISCPVCGATVDHAVRHNGFQAGGTSIGPSVIACPECGTWVGTNQSEWVEKSFLQRAWFVLQRLVWLIIGSVVVGGGMAIVTGTVAVESHWIDKSQQGTCVLTAFCAVSMLISAILVRNARREIRNSLERTRQSAVDHA